MKTKRYKLINGKGWSFFEEGKSYPSDFKPESERKLTVERYVFFFPNDWEEVKEDNKQ